MAPFAEKEEIAVIAGVWRQVDVEVGGGWETAVALASWISWAWSGADPTAFGREHGSC